MNGRLKKSIGFSLMPFAFLFLFEPRYTLVDPLPDVIGYILLCAAIINLADISPRIYEAYLGFRKAIFVSTLKYVALYMLNSFVSESASTPVYDGKEDWAVGVFHESEMAVGILLFVFVFGLFELVVLIPAYRSLFEGLLSLGTYNDGTAIYLKRITKRERIDRKTGKKVVLVRESKRNMTEKAYFLTVFLVFCQICASILPELTTLDTNTSYEFVVHLRVLFIALILPVSIIWLIKMLLYCTKIRKDTPFINSVSQKYITYVTQNPSLFTVRRLVMGISSLIVASVLRLALYVNDVKVIPAFLSSMAVVFSAIALRKYSKKWIFATIFAGINAALSAILHFATGKFYSSPLSNAEAYSAYNLLIGLSIAEAVMLAITFVFTLVMIWDIYKEHTDICFSRDQRSYKAEKLYFVKGAIACTLSAVLMAVASVYYVYVNHPYFFTSARWVVEYSSVIVLGVSLVFIGVLIYNLGNVINAIKSRYKLDI